MERGERVCIKSSREELRAVSLAAIYALRSLREGVPLAI